MRRRRPRGRRSPAHHRRGSGRRPSPRSTPAARSSCRPASRLATGSATGDVLAATAADGSVLDLRVAAVADRTLPGQEGETLLVGWSDAERLGVAGADGFAIRYATAATAEQRAAVAATRRAPSPSSPRDSTRSRARSGQALDRIFGLFDALALVAVVVAVAGHRQHAHDERARARPRDRHPARRRHDPPPGLADGRRRSRGDRAHRRHHRRRRRPRGRRADGRARRAVAETSRSPSRGARSG